MENLTETQWAWIAGIFEGEGCFSFTNKWPVCYIQMTDKDVMEKISSYLDVPIGKPKKLKSGKLAYSIAFRKTEKLKYLYENIYGYMGERRKRSLSKWQEFWDNKNLQKSGNADISLLNINMISS